nr:hypothetical protein [Candidatus Njordarchaeum guaymaensis]
MSESVAEGNSMEDLAQASNDAEEQEIFLVLYLFDDEGQSVHVEETVGLDLHEVAQHLNSGGSVFITRRKKPKQEVRRGRKTRKKQQALALV